MRTRGGTLPEMVMNAAVRWCGREVALIMAVFLSASGVCLACPHTRRKDSRNPGKFLTHAERALPCVCIHAYIRPLRPRADACPL